MTTMNQQFTDQFSKFADLQREALEPMRTLSGLATDAFERLARQNYALMGDVLNFAVEQARLPAKTTEINDYLVRQVETSRTFSELLARRTQEYVEIASTLTGKTQATWAATASKTAEAAARKVA